MSPCFVVRFLKPKKKNSLSWAFLMVLSFWLWGRVQYNLFICCGQTDLHSFYFIQLFIFIMFVEILSFETSDALWKLQKVLWKEWQTIPCIWSQAKRAGTAFVWIHKKLESRVKESDFKTLPESLQNLDPAVQSWAPSEYRKPQTMDHHSEIFIWDISV